MRDKPFHLLVFDWDGTLMDSEARIVACVRAAIADLGKTPLADSTIRNIIGLGLREAVASLFPKADETFLNHLAERYRHHFLQISHIPSPLFPAAIDTLTTLQAQGYLLAVATGKGRKGLNHVLEETALTTLFDATRCADETASKPQPEMLLQLMHELKVKPQHTLMIGDTEYDMAMATNAGVAALAVSYGVHERERLYLYNPLGCLDEIGQLLPWLEQHP